ncbi:MAG: glycosyltransferase [Candidatus Saccharibacteria bacterium]|nr:glycosyltransferase [Candidatus Saccharibacteria bacterium]
MSETSAKQQKLRIVIATPVYYPMINGVAVFSHNLAVGLARRGHEVLVLTPSQTKKNHYEMSDGVGVQYLNSVPLHFYPDQIQQVSTHQTIMGRKIPRFFYPDGFKASVFPFREVRKALDKFKPDVVHVQGADPIGIAVVNYAKKRGIPVVTTEHNQPEVLTEPLGVPGIIRQPVNSILSAYFRGRQRKSDYVTMPTRQAIEHLLGGRNLGVPVEAVSNGVDLSAFHSGAVPDEIYEKYQIPKNVPIVLYIGRVDPEKKVGIVLQAFGQFLDKHKLDSLSKTLFLVVGDGVDKEHLETEAKKMGIFGSVRFLGKILPPELYNIYRLGDVFVTASEVETQGIVLIEAAASGLPLIAVKAGAVGEVCQDGKNGFLVEPRDKQEIAEAMGKILTEPQLRKEMSEASLEIASRHSLENTLDRYIEIYRKLC